VERLIIAAMTNNSAAITNEVILKCQDKGILFWLLFEGCAIRITPPLTISDDEIREGCAIMLEVMNETFVDHN
jgi:4-aminobutyrate aminotransferase-like enzyme